VTVRDADGGYALEYGRRKVRQWPLDYGVGSLTASQPVPGTFALNRTLLDHAGFVGISSCETKRHAVTGDLYLIEINVRVPGSYGVAEASGVDGSWRLYASAAGLPLPPQPPQRDGRAAMLPELELQAVAARVRAGQQSRREVLRSWASTRDFGVLSLRDPGPAAALVWSMVRRRGTRIARERWARLRGGRPIG
jgi:D-aspartate ligase